MNEFDESRLYRAIGCEESDFEDTLSPANGTGVLNRHRADIRRYPDLMAWQQSIRPNPPNLQAWCRAVRRGFAIPTLLEILAADFSVPLLVAPYNGTVTMTSESGVGAAWSVPLVRGTDYEVGSLQLSI